MSIAQNQSIYSFMALVKGPDLSLDAIGNLKLIEIQGTEEETDMYKKLVMKL